MGKRKSVGGMGKGKEGKRSQTHQNLRHVYASADTAQLRAVVVTKAQGQKIVGK
jgi:hypothetical protein